MPATSDTPNMALFCDFENVALGVRESRYDQFDILRVLERLLLKGSIVLKKAYCDWDRYKEFKGAMHQASFELIEIPHVRMSGKNSADIRMVVDALDLCYTKAHVDTFVIISGDSDFSPLVSKLRENNKTVIGVGVKNSTSDLLIANCDEFIFYDDLVREQPQRARAARKRAAEPQPRKAGARASGGSAAAVGSGAGAAGGRAGAGGAARTGTAGVASPGAAPYGNAINAAATAALGAGVSSSTGGSQQASAGQGAAATPTDREVEDRKLEAFELVVETVDALVAERGDDETIWGSMVKQTLKRRKPGFNEGYYGFRSFNRLLEEARERGWLELELDERSGGYRVRALPADN